jgi:Protein of unknown function (DUF3016)
MKYTPLLAALVCAAFAAPVLAAPSVEVSFVDPDSYTDIGPRASKAERATTLTELQKMFKAVGTSHLKDNDRLAIEVLDVDLAGTPQLSRSRGREIRVSQDVDAPRIRLRYTLLKDGVWSRGEERITDLGHLWGIDRCKAGNGLCRERKMIEEWLERRIAGKTPPTEPR